MKYFNALLIGLILTSWSCGDDSIESIEEETEIIIEEIDIETPDWEELSHGNDTPPDYDLVFADQNILELEITITDGNWETMQTDLDNNLSSNANPDDIDFTPEWVPCTIVYNNTEWYKVGIRYKGNSTLINASRSGTDKFPFKLDFDEFESTYPAIKNQRFYGFKQLNLGNNDSDISLMRDKVAADLFREFDVPAARTTFCAVYLDRGNGQQFLGIYTLVEEVDDTLAEAQFPDGSGNLYKPDGDGASFANGTYNDEDMDKKSNEDEGDFSDINGFYDLLHDDSRTTNTDQWQSDLEAIFDVERYLKYLAINNAIQNWDTYGNMTHNFFLYNNEGKLTWLPWDYNEAMQDGKRSGTVSLSMNEVSDSWPIIRYIMDVAEYETKYDQYLEEFTADLFEPSNIAARYETHEALLSTHSDVTVSSLSAGVQILKSHATTRNQIISAHLD